MKELAKSLGTLATVVLAFCASAQDSPPLSESESLTWSRFATAWNRSQETNYNAEELRATLPGVSTGDVAWVLAERRFNREVLAESHSQSTAVSAPRFAGLFASRRWPIANCWMWGAGFQGSSAGG